MKRILCIDIEKDPHLIDIYQVVARAINETVDAHNFAPLSNDGVMKRFSEGVLPFEEMDPQMKISQSKFHHYYYGKENKEVIVQKTCTKIAVFSD